MRRFRLWLARKLVGGATFMPGNTFTTGSTAVWYSTSDGPTYSFDGTNLKKEGDVGKKKRTKAAGKAAAKAKTEKTAKRKGGKGAR